MDVDLLLNYKVYITSATDDKICLRADDRGSVNNTKGARRGWELFRIQKVGEEYVILTHHNTYLHFREASTFRSAKLKQSEDKTIGDMERFKFIPQDDNKSYLIQTPAGSYIKIGDDDGDVDVIMHWVMDHTRWSPNSLTL